MSRFLKLAGAAVLVQLGIALAAPPTTFPYPRPLPEPSAAKLPRWRGFNLLYLFNAGSAHTPAAVIEEDFRLIASLGFNFVRIPMDYRIWIAGKDWEKIDPTKLADVDRVVAMGEKYGIHVALNFHRAPGYTVAKPAEARSLWTDAGAQQVCADHWALFARRYRGVPSTRLSFNLFNEPSGVSEAGYFAVVKRMVEAIRAEDPSRLVLCDGLDYGNVPPKSLQPLGVALCTRGYRPMNISHFRASWMSGSDRWPTPDWPAPQVSAFLYGTSKSEFQSPLILTGPLGGKTLRLHVNTVSDRAKLRATDGQGTVIWEHAFVPGPGQGEWKKAVLRAEWKSYANVYDRDYTFTIPSGTNHVEIRNVDGDWVTVDSLAIDANGRSWTLNLVETWGLKQAAEVRFDPSGETVAFSRRVKSRPRLAARRLLWTLARGPGGRPRRDDRRDGGLSLHASRRRAAVDGRCARDGAGRGLGLGAVGVPRRFRRARQQTQRRRLRKLGGTPTRPRNAGPAAKTLNRPHFIASHCPNGPWKKPRTIEAKASVPSANPAASPTGVRAGRADAAPGSAGVVQVSKNAALIQPK